MFGSAPAKKVAPPKAPAPAPAKKNQSFQLFGKPAKPAAPKPPAKAAPVKSRFGGSAKPAGAPAKAAEPKVPTLKNWEQNPDGSLTGRVGNSDSFRAGTKITTSPVRKGATAGTIVTTGSGSQYKLL